MQILLSIGYWLQKILSSYQTYQIRCTKKKLLWLNFSDDDEKQVWELCCARDVEQNRELILSRIKVHLNALKRYTYGKKILLLLLVLSKRCLRFLSFHLFSSLIIPMSISLVLLFGWGWNVGAYSNRVWNHEELYASVYFVGFSPCFLESTLMF